jgi:hypothetical protein
VHKGEAWKRPRAFLTVADFRVIKDALEAYIGYLKLLKRESESYQALYTRIEIAVIQMEGENTETFNLDHEELMLLLRAILELENALSEQHAGDLERYRSLMMQQVAGVRARLLAALPSAKLGDRARLN